MLLIQEKLDEEAFPMHTGRLIFSQVMDYLPMHTFKQCVNRYQGNRKIKNFSCLDQFLCMAFAQLTYRESLRDIEVCLRAQHKKLYHMGIRGGIARNTLANANKIRDWRIYADLAQSLITTARDLYINEDLGLDLDNTVYALDASTIDLCLPVSIRRVRQLRNRIRNEVIMHAQKKTTVRQRKRKKKMSPKVKRDLQNLNRTLLTKTSTSQIVDRILS